MADKHSLLDRSVRTARGRLVGQSLLNKVAVCLAVALGASLVWFVVQPLLLEAPPKWLRWTMLGGLSAAGLLAAILWTRRTAPSREFAALEIDSRFDLRERVTTAVALTPDLRQSSAGQALLADAETRVKPIAVSEKFPVKPRWTAALAPAFAAALVAVVLWWNPAAIAWGQDAGPDGKGPETAKATPNTLQKQKADPKAKAKDALEQRNNKSDTLKELERELAELNEKYQKDPFQDTPEKTKEKVAELTPLEDKLKKFNEEKEQKLQQLADKLSQLEKLNKEQGFDEGPAEGLKDALSKGDIKKAEEEVDELKKKAKDKKLDKEDAQKLSKQLDQMKNELEKLARDKERKDKLKKEIEKAKQEGKDAESLERELEKMEQEQKQSAELMEKLAQQMGAAKDALDKEDMEQVAEELAKAGKTLEQIEAEVEDLKDGEATLQRLKEARAKACAACEGKDGEKKKWDGKESKGGPGGEGAGKREINDKADGQSVDERVRSPFDIKGKKTFGGLTKGQAFTKKTDKELGSAIQQAAQEAPGAAEVQRLPRDARDSVKEYFEKLGGTKGEK